MFLNERRVAMLTQLINYNETMRIGDMARRFHVSERTVRYDLDAIDEYLQDHQTARLVRQKDGVSLAGQKVRAGILGLLSKASTGAYECALSASQRKYMILSELLNATGYSTINGLAAAMLFSRNTIIKDLAAVKEWLTHNKLKFHSAPKYGIKIEGDEAHIRKAILKMLQEAFSLEQYLELVYNKLSATQGDTYPFILYRRIFREVRVDALLACIRCIEARLNVVFTDISFINLVLCLAIMIQRLRTGHYISLTGDDVAGPAQSRAFAIIAEESAGLQQSLQLTFPPAELAFFTQYVCASHVTSNNNKENKPIECVLISNLIAVVSRDLGESLSHDKQLFDCLYQEIVPAFYRIKHGLPVQNPYLHDIKAHYGDLFCTIQNNLAAIEEYSGSRLSEDEIGYVTLHFQVALEQLRKRGAVPNLLVVCGTGIGTANLLAAKIEEHFNVNIVATSALHDVAGLIQSHDIDLIVSTIPCVIDSVPAVVGVSPILSSGDIALLRKYFNERSRCPKGKPYCGHKGGTETGKTDLSSPEGEARTPRLTHVLRPELIRLDISVANWQEAIEYAGLVLYESGYIEYPYIRSMIDMVRERGPYIAFWKGIALPHSNAVASVRRLGISYVRLKPPIPFGHGENDPVDMVFAFATPNEHCHINALMELSHLLSSRTAVEELRSAASAGAVQDVIRSFCTEPGE